MRAMILAERSLLSGILCIVMAACNGASDCAPWTRAIIDLPQQERLSRFATLPIDSQFVLVLCQNRTVRPSPLDLSTAFADQGSAVVQYLKQQLADVEDDSKVHDIVLILSFVPQSAYDVTADTSLQALMKQRVEEMDDTELRAAAREIITSVWP